LKRHTEKRGRAPLTFLAFSAFWNIKIAVWFETRKTDDKNDQIFILWRLATIWTREKVVYITLLMKLKFANW